MTIDLFVKENFDAYIDLICQLTAIPAPSFKEERRAKFICDYLHELGFRQAFIDEAKNVICEIKGRDSDKEVHIFMAHTDTVFPDETPIPVSIEDGCIKAPGVGDDTTNVCAILMTLKYLAHSQTDYGTKNVPPTFTPKYDTVFCLNACEEGLGNLKGCKALVERYKSRLTQLISFDCGYDTATILAVGSRRFEISVKTKGGHSFADFGNTNAIAAAAEMISDLYQVDASMMPGKTTYNVGMIHGGTSVNTIAQNAAFMYEYRSDTTKGLEMMSENMENIMQKYCGREDLCVEIKKIGDRPSMGNVAPDKMRALQEKAEKIIVKNTGILPIFGSGSTDCNIPLSLGIPAICFGTYLGDGQHTREEYVKINSLKGGLKAAMEMVISDMA